MNYLLDTDICIYIIKRKPPEVIQQFRTLALSEVGISVITVSELEYGAAKSQHSKRNRMALQQFLIPLEVIAFEARAAQIYGELRSDLERKGQMIGSLDMLIAAQALSLDLKLVTNNTREFSRIAGLKLENWVA